MLYAIHGTSQSIKLCAKHQDRRTHQRCRASIFSTFYFRKQEARSVSVVVNTNLSGGLTASAARDILRVQEGPERHHFASGRAGLYIGLSIPAIVSGLQKALDPAHQQHLPEWPRLLQLFGALGQPVVFAILFSMCIETFRYYRINYVLIFELDIRTRIDSVQYLELPSFLFLIFSYCFWLSFSNFWPNHIVPWAWPRMSPLPHFNIRADKQNQSSLLLQHWRSS